MGAFLAPSLVRLRAEINAAHPNRDKASDGWIGDPAHAGRVSDHNPDSITGVVRALDIDKDGMDPAEYRRVVLSDHRTEYFIQFGLIYSRRDGFRARIYTGPNRHDAHGHVSIRHGYQWEQDTAPWGYKQAAEREQPAPEPEKIDMSARIVKGDGKGKTPNGKFAWGDFQFVVRVDPTFEKGAVRSYLPAGPVQRALEQIQGGVDVVKQADLDKIPFVEGGEVPTSVTG